MFIWIISFWWNYCNVYSYHTKQSEDKTWTMKGITTSGLPLHQTTEHKDLLIHLFPCAVVIHKNNLHSFVNLVFYLMLPRHTIETLWPLLTIWCSPVLVLTLSEPIFPKRVCNKCYLHLLLNFLIVSQKLFPSTVRFFKVNSDAIVLAFLAISNALS